MSKQELIDEVTEDFLEYIGRYESSWDYDGVAVDARACRHQLKKGKFTFMIMALEEDGDDHEVEFKIDLD